VITPKSSFPIFTVASLERARSYYERHFGFGVAFENDWYLHLVSDSGVQVGFLLPNQPTQPEVFHQSFDGAGVIFSFEIDDADSAYAEAKENALDIVLSLRSEEWGQRHFCVRDPNGVYLDIVQAIEPKEEYIQGYHAD
jgi:uncharacterized glyoxalase superfamily protein PhnB